MIPFSSFFFFILIAVLLLPTIILGLRGKRMQGYNMFATVVALALIFSKDAHGAFFALLVYSVASLDHPLVPFVPVESKSSVCLLYGSGGIDFAACTIKGFTVLFNSSAASTAANELAELFRDLVLNI